MTGGLEAQPDQSIVLNQSNSQSRPGSIATTHRSAQDLIVHGLLDRLHHRQQIVHQSTGNGNSNVRVAIVRIDRVGESLSI